MLNYFLQTIRQLRLQETVTLYEVWSPQRQYNETEVIRFLEQSYQAEALTYPFDPPEFDAAAALWSARTMYMACQFLLNRSLADSDMLAWLPDFQDAPSPARILSADLTLRFAPDVLYELTNIDPEDPLIDILTKHLTQWHYSGIRAGLDPATLDFTVVLQDPCVHQLYLNRVIRYKQHTLATHPDLLPGIRHHLGANAEALWPGLSF